MTFLNLDSRWFSSRIKAHLWAGFGCSAWLTPSGLQGQLDSYCLMPLSVWSGVGLIISLGSFLGIPSLVVRTNECFK